MRVNEIFYSIQGEGFHTGTPAVFIRLSGCNLRCPFCDTDFSNYTEMSEDEIVEEVGHYPATLVVVTGGEPTLQLTSSLVEKLHSIGKYVAIETNGTRTIPDGVDWVTCSPKQAYVGKSGKPIIFVPDEIKVVFDGEHDVDEYGMCPSFCYIQPCDTGSDEKNKEIIEKCVEFIKNNPKWRLSLQTQKILNVR